MNYDVEPDYYEYDSDYAYDEAHSEFLTLHEQLDELAHRAGQSVTDWLGAIDDSLRAKMAALREELASGSGDPSSWQRVKAGVREKLVDLRASYDKAKIRMEEHGL